MCYNGCHMQRVPTASIALAVVRHPALWGEAVRAMAAMAPREWWKRLPFLPVPDREFLRWRIATAYGTVNAPLPAHDVVAFLEWRRRQRRAR
jgi:hypothetical protein